MDKKLLNIEEAAEYLGVAVQTLYQWVSMKKIPYVKLSHKVLRFNIYQLDRWIEKNTVNATDSVDFMPSKVYNQIKGNGNGNI